MFSDVPCEFSITARCHDGHHGAEVQFPVLCPLLLHWQSFSVVLNESLLGLCWRLHTVANRFCYSGYWLHGLNKQIRFYHLQNDSADGSDQIWKTNRIWVQCEQRLSAEGNWEILSLVSLHLQRWATVDTCLPDGESLMMLDSCPQRRHSAYAWESYRWSHLRNRAQSCRGVDLHSCLKLDKTLEFPQWMKTEWKGLFSPLTGLQWGRAPTSSSSDSHHHLLYNMIVTLCGRRENDYPHCLYTQKTSTVKVTVE